MIFFFILGILAIASAVFTVTARNPVASAVGLIFHFFMLAGIYLTLQAQFVAVTQILVYAGAIMILVVFVIMLLNLGDEEKLKEKISLRKVFGTVLALAIITEIGAAIASVPVFKPVLPAESLNAGSIEGIGDALFGFHLAEFEAIGILLTAAIVGAVVTAKKKLQ